MGAAWRKVERGEREREREREPLEHIWAMERDGGEERQPRLNVSNFDQFSCL